MSAGQIKQKIWEAHIENAGRHPDGVPGYCREAGINLSGFYQWRKRLFGKRKTKAVASFVPVEVQSAIARDFSRSKIDAEWVGQMLSSFVRGLS